MSDIEEPKKATITSDKDVPTKHYSFLFYDRDDAAPFAALKVCAAISSSLKRFAKFSTNSSPFAPSAKDDIITE